MKGKIILLLTLIVSLLPLRVICEENTLDLTCKSAILVDSKTGNILFEKNPDEKLPLASVTKIMTMLLAMERIDEGKMDYDDIITASQNAKSYGGSTIFLDEGEKMSVSDILKGIAVASGNDAAVAMAEHISGTHEEFVKLMNQRAKELGMINTNFVNANGLDEDNHYSTARDIAIMSRELMKHEKIFDYTKIWMDSLRNGEFTLSNTNKLIRFYDGATGLKTGSTSKAMFCISATAKKNNMHLIAVIMASPTSKERQSDASKLLDYGFNNFELVDTFTDDSVLNSVKIQKAKNSTLNVKISGDTLYLKDKNTNPEIKTNINIKKDICAPTKKGEKVGDIQIIIDEKPYKKFDILAAEDVKREGFTYFFGKILYKYLS